MLLVAEKKSYENMTDDDLYQEFAKQLGERETIQKQLQGEITFSGKSELHARQKMTQEELAALLHEFLRRDLPIIREGR
ncbi:MAG: hypothetical protein ACE5OZ_13140 [Candidatus Heimdallarchaeota archaeon]